MGDEDIRELANVLQEYTGKMFAHLYQLDNGGNEVPKAFYKRVAMVQRWLEAVEFYHDTFEPMKPTALDKLGSEMNLDDIKMLTAYFREIEKGERIRKELLK